MEYKSHHVQKMFDVSAETVRNWADEFSNYLSVTANPGTGRHRIFTHEDMRVFALVSQLKTSGLTYADIHASLENGQRGELPDVFQVGDEVQIALRLDQAREIILRMEGERNDAIAELQEMREEKIKVQTQLADTRQRIQELNDQLEKSRQRIEELNREVGESYVKGIMEAMERRGDLPKKDG